ncbi:hypothetical protein [Deinococcus hohokamensis]|uniref:Antitoxin n=1 Tax=Deinococcus hohokamensis TaxID=309883 RepID=A0ABV9I685_9DEIO
MTVGKISVSLETDLLVFLTTYQERHHLRSKSEAVAQALELLRERELETQYTAALQDWQDSGEAEVWDTAVGDALTEGPRAPR